MSVFHAYAHRPRQIRHNRLWNGGTFQSAISEAQVDRLRLVINDAAEGNKEGEADQKQIDRVSRSLNSHIKTRLRPSRISRKDLVREQENNKENERTREQ